MSPWRIETTAQGHPRGYYVNWPSSPTPIRGPFFVAFAASPSAAWSPNASTGCFRNTASGDLLLT